ncbi:splicing regulator RBM11 isoform X1 [Perognathus longimembris pacificus]|uniref:splicing regulator RBM11 isoform X1 n=1 Tax=Perognathus longimembris pacificus TaxID=214514 RepID=UPI002018A27E|nr:splicing regulator RBM11 isoform X1 [Perognathus longimembris pacificus]
MFPAQEEADRTVFVGNLEARVREEILYELFLQAGPLTKVTICKDREGKPKSFGFVCFKHPESVSYAIALLNGIRLYGRPINVQYRFGSSRCSEPATQNFENSVKINSQSYRSEDMVGRSSFAMQFFPINNTALPQEYVFFQKMVSLIDMLLNVFYSNSEGPECFSFLILNYKPVRKIASAPKQWYSQSPPAQLPYYEMTAPASNNAPGTSAQNHLPSVEPGPSSYEWTHRQPSDSALYQMNKRKRQKQTSDSDSSTENNPENKYNRKFQKYKKKKRY